MKENIKLGLVCSSGGHFLQLYGFRAFWQDFDRFWVTFPQKDTRQFLYAENTYNACYPTNRSIVNLIRNLILAFRILKKERPDVIISTGAGVAVPFIYVGKLLGVRTVYVESATRIHSLSLAGRLVYPVVDHFIVQWPELAKKHKRAKFKGRGL